MGEGGERREEVDLWRCRKFCFRRTMRGICPRPRACRRRSRNCISDASTPSSCLFYTVLSFSFLFREDSDDGFVVLELV